MGHFKTKPLLIFYVGAYNGDIEAGAIVLNTTGVVVGGVCPKEVESMMAVEMTHLESSLPLASVSKPSLSMSSSKDKHPSQL